MSKNSARNSVQTFKEWIAFMKLDKKRKPKKVEFVDDERNSFHEHVTKAFKK